ncbi:hypothetical protein BGY98DRAFT_960928 [Russula aff. rugulosa BPL654]|nr:hypothetical protein BGY98DRAFT_960928 [Russula aff. rugulosa BPL654]
MRNGLVVWAARTTMTGVVVVQNSTHTIQRVVHGQLARIHSHDVWAIVGAHTPCTLWAKDDCNSL